ncbi:MAG TPA: hypothetical protein PKA28_02690 [Methylomusa anaerophila]|uniref:Uncharacterized protein n=1 Tax=Methylomusa anaerophila TaxID=1930071 RepID=A0A348AP23_9FIRM|nr:hypothetical protein [Methylomusa anaerophila]BBB92821.1 hypothetical protein MAMMFC1_03526 [Methylomusa anaerophila]HML87339.1 hypothetical protein [Methylomusa anaerophila]
MKKMAAMMLIVFAVPLFFPAMPRAEAALLDDKLTQRMAQNPTVSQVQSIINITNSIQKSEKQDLWSILVKAVMEQSGNAEAVNGIASAANDIVTLNASIQDPNILGKVKVLVQNKVEEHVKESLIPYEDKLNTLAELINAGNVLYSPSHSKQ